MMGGPCLGPGRLPSVRGEGEEAPLRSRERRAERPTIEKEAVKTAK